MGALFRVLFLLFAATHQVHGFLSLRPRYTRRLNAGVPGAEGIALRSTRQSTGVSGADINQEIIDCLSSRGRTEEDILSKAKTIVNLHARSLNHVHAITLLSRAAKIKLCAIKHFDAKMLLSALRKNGRSKGAPWTAAEIGLCLFGLRGVDRSSKQVVVDVVKTVQAQLEEHSCTEDAFGGQEMAMAFYGLQSLPSVISKGQMNVLLETLGSKFSESAASSTKPFSLSSHEVSNILYGLRNLNDNDNPAVLSVLDLVVTELRKKRSEDLTFTAQGIASSLNGLRHISAHSSSVRAILTELTPHVSAALPHMTHLSVGSALGGLSAMTADSAEVRNLLGLLAQATEALAEGSLPELTITGALCGISSMSDDVAEVRRLIAALTRAAPKAGSKLSSQGVGVLFNALQNKAADHQETRELIALFSSKVPATMRASDVAKSIYGFKSVSTPSSEVLGALSVLSAPLIEGGLTSELTPKDVATMLYGTRFLVEHAGENVEIQAILAAAALRLLTMVRDSAGKGEGEGLTQQGLRMCMRGLAKADKEGSTEVGAILAALGSLISSSGPADAAELSRLSGYTLSVTLNALNGAKCDAPAVKSLVTVLAAALKRERLQLEAEGLPVPQLTATEVCHCFFGLQNMDSSHPEVIALLSELVPRSRFVPGEDTPSELQYSSAGLGFAVTGFQTMSSEDSPVVVEALGLFSDKIDSLPQTMKPTDMANALFGLQGMLATHEDVRAVVSALTNQMQKCHDQFSPRDISFCLQGLSDMERHGELGVEEVQALLSEINLKVALSPLKGHLELRFKTFGTGGKVIPVDGK